MLFRSIKASLKLTPRDINNLDFRSPKYIAIEGDGYYYHLQRISNYSPTEIGSIECELVRVINPMPQVDLTGIIAPVVNEVSPIEEAINEQVINDEPMQIDIPTRVVIDGVEQTIDVEYNLLGERGNLIHTMMI